VKPFSERDLKIAIEIALERHQADLRRGEGERRKALTTIVEQIRQRRKHLDEAIQLLESLNPGILEKRRPGRPKGSKNKGKMWN